MNSYRFNDSTQSVNGKRGTVNGYYNFSMVFVIS